jgi:hypothetical protein
MLNRDVNSRFEDWLLNPRETLDFEVKQWLDLSDVEHQGIVAKALIALENHGGGFLLFGYKDADGILVPDPNRPSTLEPYLTDSINAIVKKRAEPVFHVEVTLQRHPETGEEFPLVRVAGSSRVPVRSDSETPERSLRLNVYYLRAPGPESRGPVNAAEWDTLVRRAVRNQRDEIIDLLRSLSPDGRLRGTTPQTTEADRLRVFNEKARTRWAALNGTLPDDHQGKIKLGHFIFSARIVGTMRGLGAQAIIQANQSARRYTGWAGFVTIHQEQTRPRLVDDCIEAWLANASYPDVSHADFWRIDPQGNFFLLRGYQEDSSDAHMGFATPGTVFEITLPVWRLGEFLLRVADLGEVMFEGDFEIIVNCSWTGLKGRRLTVQNRRRFLASSYVCSVDTVTTEAQIALRDVRDLLPETVRSLELRLYEHFDFFTPPEAFFKEELDEMLKNRF